MSQADLAKLVHVHPDLIAKVEKAARWPTEALAASCDTVLATGGLLIALWPDVARERDEHRRPDRSSETSDGDDLRAFESIGEVAGRLWRLGDANTEAALSIVRTGIADIVERYETENPEVLAPQAVTLRRNLDSMVTARPTSTQRRVLLTLAGQASGLLAYMAVNLGRFAHADAYSIEAHALAKEAGDPGLMAWVRGTQSFASYYRRDYPKALEFARDGLRSAGNGPQAVRLLINCEARSLAFLPGRKRDAERAVAQAYKAADQFAGPGGISPCVSFGPYSRGRVVANAITVFQTLSETERAIDLVAEVEDAVETSNSAWSRSLIGFDHAAILLHSSRPDVERAMHLACSALAASSDRLITSVVDRGQALVRASAPFGDLPVVREFQERMRMAVVASGQRRGSSHGRHLRSQA
jgi:hypothetical protein